MDSKKLLRKIAAEHHTPAIHVNRRDGKQCLCPHCGKELTAKDIYKDIKGWEFCRSCFRKGKGSIKTAAKKKEEDEKPRNFLKRIWDHVSSNPKIYGTLAASALAGAGTYAWNRRIHDSNLTASQGNIAKSIRDKGLGLELQRAQPQRSKIFNYLRYGTPHVQPRGDYADFEPSRWLKGSPKVIWSPDSMIDNKQNVIGGKRVIGAGVDVPAVGNKYEEAKLFNRHAPGAMAQSSRIPKIIGSRNKSIDNTVNRLSQLQEQLKQDRPGGYILKGVGDAQSGNRLLTDEHNLPSLYNQLSKMDPTGLSQNHQMKLKHLVDIAHYPQKMFVQDKLKLNRQGLLDRVFGRIFGKNQNSTQEYRVHTIGDRILPATTARYGPISQMANLIGVRTPGMAQAENAVREAIGKLPRKFVNNRSFGFDVGHTPTGPKIIESNPSGYSGLLFGPDPGSSVTEQIVKGTPQSLMMHRIVSSLQGRDTHLLAGLKGTGAALGTAGMIGGGVLANKLLTDKDENDQPPVKLADFGGGGDAAAQGQSATTPPLPTEGDGSASTGGEDAAGMVDLHDPEKLDTDVFDLSAIKKAVLFDGMSDGTEDNQIANDDTGVEYSRRARRYSTDWRQHFMNLTQTPPYQESSAAGAQGKTLAPTGAGEPQSSQTPAMSGQDDGTGTHMQLDSSTMNFGPTRHMNA